MLQNLLNGMAGNQTIVYSHYDTVWHDIVRLTTLDTRNSLRRDSNRQQRSIRQHIQPRAWHNWIEPDSVLCNP